MANRILKITVERDDLISIYEFPFENVPGRIKLPEDAPLPGKEFFITTDGKGGFEFTPDAAENFIRFGEDHAAELTEYGEDLRAYRLTFQILRK